jgi:EmrB/QacA subfamily drug resistance transporter
MATQPTSTVAARGEDAPGRPTRFGLALTVIAGAQLMVLLDVTIVNIALPSIQKALHFTPTGLEWVVNAYTLVFGGLLLLGGRLGDLLGRRRMFVIGLLLFTFGSMAGGFANSAAWLIAARAGQGVGGAIIAPTALSLIADTFPEGNLRNRAIGVYSAMAGAGGAIGLLLGGVITTYLSWRWVLFVNVPIGLALALAAPRFLKATSGRRGHLDLPGAVSVTAGMTLLVYGLNHAAAYGWSDNLTRGALLAAAALLVTFLFIETRSAQPLMPLRIFASRNRAGAYSLSLAIGVALFGIFFFLTQFTQDILGYSPLKAGLAFLPITAGIVVTATVVSRVVGRTGARLPVTLGPLFVAGGLFWLSRITDHTTYLSGVLGPMVLLGMGVALVFVPLSLIAVAGARPRELGLAASLLNVGQQVGGSMGLALLGTVAATTTRQQLQNVRPTRELVNQAIVAGYSNALELGVVIALAGFVVALLVIRNGKAPATEEVQLETRSVAA